MLQKLIALVTALAIILLNATSIANSQAEDIEDTYAFLGQNAGSVASGMALACKPDQTIKAAIDIGSSSTKLQIACISKTQTNGGNTYRIESTRKFKPIPVKYGDDLRKSKKREFSKKIMAQGESAISQLEATALSYGATEIRAGTTHAFREAVNGDAFVNNLSNQFNNITFKRLIQKFEGELEFRAVADSTGRDFNKIPLVWSTGSNSMQLTFAMKNKAGDYVIHSIKGGTASEKFQSTMCGILPKCNSKNGFAYPIRRKQWKRIIHAADALAKMNISKKVRSKSRNKTVYVLGGTFEHSPAARKSAASRNLSQGVSKCNKFQSMSVKKAICFVKDMKRRKRNKNNISKLISVKSNYLDNSVSNLVLIDRYTKRLRPKELKLIDTDLRAGILVYDDWANAPSCSKGPC